MKADSHWLRRGIWRAEYNKEVRNDLRDSQLQEVRTAPEVGFAHPQPIQALRQVTEKRVGYYLAAAAPSQDSEQ